MKRRCKIWHSDSFEIKRIKIFDSSEFKRQVKLAISILLKSEESEFLILLKLSHGENIPYWQGHPNLSGGHP
jgi:hypothetical protein